MKRILTIDGGGIRGLFALQILKRIETLVLDRHGQALHEYFHLIAGTSTGGIIATLLSWGYSVGEIDAFYWEHAHTIFSRNRLIKLLQCRFRCDRFSALLKETFQEANGDAALLGTQRLKTLLLLIMRNASTGAPWPICNNPHATYNDPALPDCNLNLPLWQIVRAGTAAPTFFQPELLPLGDHPFWFVDGAVSPYGNPSLIALLFALLPEYRIGWTPGEDNLLLLSVGTGCCRKNPSAKSVEKMNLLQQAALAFNLTISSQALHEDLLCRLLGRCLYGAPIDSELGDQKDCALFQPRLCAYARYDRVFGSEEVSDRRIGNRLGLDNLRAMPFLRDAGLAYAAEAVRAEHLL